jgi:hypothetical protein
MAQKCNEVTRPDKSDFQPSYVTAGGVPVVFAIVYDPGKHHPQKPSPSAFKKLVFTLIPVVL